MQFCSSVGREGQPFIEGLASLSKIQQLRLLRMYVKAKEYNYLWIKEFNVLNLNSATCRLVKVSKCRWQEGNAFHTYNASAFDGYIEWKCN